jgi:hypothetical protein
MKKDQTNMTTEMAYAPLGEILYDERGRSEHNYRRSLLAIAELIRAIVEEMSEQEVQKSVFADEFSDGDL